MLKSKIYWLFKQQIFYVFLLALFIRFLFVFLEYPFVFHPDEPTVVNSTINLRYNPNPMHFDWPTFYYYFNYPFFFVYEKLYFISIDLGLMQFQPIEEINYYIVSRFLTTFFGAATVIVVYFILKNLNIPHKLSLIGACIMAILPFHVTRSAQALTDAPMVFFASLVLLILTKILISFNERYFLIACFLAGLSVSTKYNGYMIFLSLGLFLVLIKGFSFKDTRLYLKSALVSILGFFIGTPYFIFDYQTFFSYEYGKGALWQFENVGKVEFTEQVNQFFSNLFIQNYSLMGYIPLIASLLYIFIFLFKKEFLVKDSLLKFKFILIVQFLYIFWSVSGVETQRSHYLFLTYLFLPLFTVFFMEKYLNYKYLSELIYLVLVIFCTYSLYIRIGDVAAISFYNRVEIVGDRKNLLVSFNNKDIEKVLNELKVPKVKFNPNSQSFSSKVTHVVSTTDICIKMSKCSFDLIEKIVSRADNEVIYVFKRK